MTLQAAINDFLIEQHIRGNTSKTIRYYSLCLGLFARYAGEDVQYRKLLKPPLKAIICTFLGNL